LQGYLGQKTYIHDTLNSAQGSRDRGANKWDSVEEAGFANQDVEEGLVDCDELLSE